MRLSPLVCIALSWGMSSSQAFVTPMVAISTRTRVLTPVASNANEPRALRTSLSGMPQFLDGSIKAASSVTGSLTSGPLFNYFMETLISYAVPAFFTIVTFVFAARAFKGDNRDDEDIMSADTVIGELYSDLYGRKKSAPPNPFKKADKDKIRNLGVPASQYIKITNMNEKYDSYDFSLSAATNSKAYAAAKYRSKSFDRALELALTGDTELPTFAKSQLLGAEKDFLKQGKKLVSVLQALEGELTRDAIDTKLKSIGVKTLELDPEPLEKKDGDVINATIMESSSSENATATTKRSESKSKSKSSILQSISKVQRELQQLELDFIQNVVAAVGPQRAIGVRTALLGDIAARGTGGMLSQLEARPLSSLLRGSDSESQKKSLFVMRFPGDVTASQLDGLREEVTAILRNAKPGDEALVVLQSGGGTVTGYGLAAGQLVRLKEKGLFLTIAVEQVAASGGYMMTCVADRIVASPFAVLGSIGVISEIPNVYQRLKDEGIEFQTVTAGKFKRTITPTKRVTKDDFAKAKEDVEGILVQFSDFVKKNRPSLDIDSVATGETWFGEAALEKGLCDEIKTVDDVLLNYVDLGFNVYDLEYSPPSELPGGLAGLIPAGAQSAPGNPSLGRRIVRWFVETLGDEIGNVAKTDSIERRYMARDDSYDRYR